MSVVYTKLSQGGALTHPTMHTTGQSCAPHVVMIPAPAKSVYGPDVTSAIISHYAKAVIATRCPNPATFAGYI